MCEGSLLCAYNRLICGLVNNCVVKIWLFLDHSTINLHHWVFPGNNATPDPEPQTNPAAESIDDIDIDIEMDIVRSAYEARVAPPSAEPLYQLRNDGTLPGTFRVWDQFKKKNLEKQP